MGLFNTQFHFFLSLTPRYSIPKDDINAWK